MNSTITPPVRPKNPCDHRGARANTSKNEQTYPRKLATLPSTERFPRLIQAPAAIASQDPSIRVHGILIGSQMGPDWTLSLGRRAAGRRGGSITTSALAHPVDVIAAGTYCNTPHPIRAPDMGSQDSSSSPSVGPDRTAQLPVLQSSPYGWGFVEWNTLPMEGSKVRLTECDVILHGPAFRALSRIQEHRTHRRNTYLCTSGVPQWQPSVCRHSASLPPRAVKRSASFQESSSVVTIIYWKGPLNPDYLGRGRLLRWYCLYGPPLSSPLLSQP